MRQGSKPRPETVVLSGSGSGWFDAPLEGLGSLAGWLSEIKVRSTGGATLVTLYVVESDVAVVAAPDGLATPYKYSALLLAASSSELSLTDPIAPAALLARGVGKRVVGNITAVGAFTVRVTAAIEREA